MITNWLLQNRVRTRQQSVLQDLLGEGVSRSRDYSVTGVWPVRSAFRHGNWGFCQMSEAFGFDFRMTAVLSEEIAVQREELSLACQQSRGADCQFAQHMRGIFVHQQTSTVISDKHWVELTHKNQSRCTQGTSAFFACHE